MMRRLILAAAVIAMGGPAYGQARCSKPYAPTISPNAKPTMQDLVSMRSDVTAFVAASDLYQACLTRRHDVASVRMIDESQAEKERVAKNLNTVIRAFNAANRS